MPVALFPLPPSEPDVHLFGASGSPASRFRKINLRMSVWSISALCIPHASFPKPSAMPATLCHVSGFPRLRLLRRLRDHEPLGFLGHPAFSASQTFSALLRWAFVPLT